MRARPYEISEEDAEATVRNLKAAVRASFSGPGLVANYHTIAFHMMMTFYFVLIVMAIVAGKAEVASEEMKQPSLMSFVLLWHLFAIPIWFLRKFTLRICREPLGMLVGFVVVAIGMYGLKDFLATALINLVSWTQSAPGELLQYFGI